MRPLSFKLLAAFFTCIFAGMVIALPYTVPDGNARVWLARAGLVPLTVLSGIVIVGLWRADRWVGLAMDLWMAVFAATMLVVVGPDDLLRGGVWGELATLAVMYAPVVWVKDRLRLIARGGRALAP